MVWPLIRKRGFIPLLLILAALVYWRIHARSPKYLSIGYVADRNVTLYNTLAQVQQPVAEAHYGDRVEVLRLEGSAAQVRTGSGTVGWVRDSRQIMDSDLWGKSLSLVERTRSLPIQARGHTKTVSNVRAEASRDGKRIYQFVRGTPVLVLGRAVADATQASDENSPAEKNSAAGESEPKREDWLLVLRAPDSAPISDAKPSSGESTSVRRPSSSSDPASHNLVGGQPNLAAVEGPSGPVAGWVLARFIEYELPGPVKDYASSADLHVVAWFELNRVPDGSGGEVPQYLVAGSRGSEGQACDFTALRVYTWGKARKRYETAYVESDLCGRLPVQVANGEKGPEFRFLEAGTGNDRVYFMQQTAVRRIKGGTSPRRPSRK